MAFDGIVTRAIASELQNLTGGRIDKIFQPNKDFIILGFYYNGNNYALNICTNSKNCRIHLTTHLKSNPKVAPAFCMLLRKYLIGLRIKNIVTDCLERIVTIELEGFDDVDDIINRKLVVELMGKHCNIILLDEQNIIIDCLRHINSDLDNKSRLPHIKYIYPNCCKNNFLEVNSFDDFKSKFIENNLNIENLPLILSNTFNGISKSFIQHVIHLLKIDTMSDENLNKIYVYIKNLINAIDDNCNLKFELISDKDENLKDYFLTFDNFSNLKINSDSASPSTMFSLNFFIDDFYFKKESSEEFKVYRNSVLKVILDTLKKYNKRLININNKLNECDNMELYRLYGELITSNLYRIKDMNFENIILENYYDNNKPISIPLDKRYSPSINAKRYFKKYHKLKNALEIVSIQKQETLQELHYIESIVYELESSSTLEEVAQIFDEISENVIFKEKTDNLKNNKYSKAKKSKLTKNKNVSFNPLKFSIENYTLLVGRNNKENDYLTLKYAKKTDLWFHTKDIHGSHAVLLLPDTKSDHIIEDNILIKCAQIAAFHSKARNSSNVHVDYCEVKFVKKPNGAKPGMVIYSNNKTLIVNPKSE